MHCVKAVTILLNLLGFDMAGSLGTHQSHTNVPRLPASLMIAKYLHREGQHKLVNVVLTIMAVTWCNVQQEYWIVVVLLACQLALQRGL